MNNKLLILAIILIVICVIYLINFLKVKNKENFFNSYDLQNNTTNKINDTQEKSDENNSKITKTGEDLDIRKNNILNTLQKTNDNLEQNKESVEEIIRGLDVLSPYETDLNEFTKERTVKSEYNGKKCKDTNLDLRGSAQGNDALEICAINCKNTPECNSFHYDKVNKLCRLSSLCTLNNADNDNDFDLYFKIGGDVYNPLTNYTLYSNKKCKNTTNTLSHESPTIRDCAENCTNNPECISFDYNTNNNTCRLTKDCYNENTDGSNNYNLYQRKDIIIHPYEQIRDIPCEKKFNIVYHKFHNNFCVDSDGNKAKLKRCSAKGDNDNQTFVYNSNGYLENNNGKCLYYNDTGTGPQHDKEIKLETCPTNPEIKNYQWTFKNNTKGTKNTLAIVSNLRNKSTNKEYAIDARKGIKWLIRNDLKNDLKSNNNSQLTLIEYNNNNQKDWKFSRWFRDYYN
jgi:hypothetical protein